MVGNSYLGAWYQFILGAQFAPTSTSQYYDLQDVIGGQYKITKMYNF